MNKEFIIIYTTHSPLGNPEHRGKEFKSTHVAKSEDEAKEVFHKFFPFCDIKNIYIEN